MERANYEGISTDCSQAAPQSARKRGIPGGLLGAGFLLGEQLEGIEQPAVGQDLVVEVRAGGATGRTETSNQIATLDVVALMDLET